VARPYVLLPQKDREKIDALLRKHVTGELLEGLVVTLEEYGDDGDQIKRVFTVLESRGEVCEGLYNLIRPVLGKPRPFRPLKNGVSWRDFPRSYRRKRKLS
jgi:hypothetical protein